MILNKAKIDFCTETKFYLVTFNGENNDKPVMRAKSLSKLLKNIANYYKGQGE